jgi:hypothetical protein
VAPASSTTSATWRVTPIAAAVPLTAAWMAGLLSRDGRTQTTLASSAKPTWAPRAYGCVADTAAMSGTSRMWRERSGFGGRP